MIGWPRSFEMFEIAELEVEKVKIFGKEYEAKKPTVKQVRDLQSKLNSAGETKLDVIGTMLEFFEDIGLPKEQLENVSMKNLEALIEHFSGSKKN